MIVVRLRNPDTHEIKKKKSKVTNKWKPYDTDESKESVRKCVITMRSMSNNGIIWHLWNDDNPNHVSHSASMNTPVACFYLCNIMMFFYHHLPVIKALEMFTGTARVCALKPGGFVSSKWLYLLTSFHFPPSIKRCIVARARLSARSSLPWIIRV